MPYVKWRLGAVELTPEETIPVGKNVLMLTDVRESANYTCVAASDLGNIEAVAHVKVKGTVMDHNSTKQSKSYDQHLCNTCRYITEVIISTYISEFAYFWNVTLLFYILTVYLLQKNSSFLDVEMLML